MIVSIFVTGATGYIAQHVVKMLIEKNYKVVGSVRSAEKGERLKASLKSVNFVYEVVPDIQIEGAFDDALKRHPEITVVLHTASPFHFNTNNPEKDLMLPAVHGTENALNAIMKYAPQVKRVVITSSVAAISTAAKESDPNVVFNESSWNEVTWEEGKNHPATGYRASKKFAEKSAWDFVRQEKPNFVLSTVNPALVFGPQAFDSEVKDVLNTSAEKINELLKLGPNDKVPESNFFYIDVRDVALAHLAAFEEKETKNERLFLADGRFTSQDILDILNENFTELKGKIPLGEPGAGFEQKKGLARIDNEKTRNLLGFDFVDLKKTVIDTVQQVLENQL